MSAKKARAAALVNMQINPATLAPLYMEKMPRATPKAGTPTNVHISMWETLSSGPRLPVSVRIEPQGPAREVTAAAQERACVDGVWVIGAFSDVVYSERLRKVTGSARQGRRNLAVAAPERRESGVEPPHSIKGHGGEGGHAPIATQLRPYGRRRLAQPEKILLGLAYRGDEGDVVALGAMAEALHILDNRGDQILRRQATVAAQGFDQALLTKFLAFRIE